VPFDCVRHSLCKQYSQFLTGLVLVRRFCGLELGHELIFSNAEVAALCLPELGCNQLAVNAPSAAPMIGPHHITQWLRQSPRNSAGPKTRAGFKATPVSGFAAPMPIITVKPINTPASGWDSSTATRKTTNAKKKVRTISIAMPASGDTPVASSVTSKPTFWTEPVWVNVNNALAAALLPS
jgi:hypothetical protein